MTTISPVPSGSLAEIYPSAGAVNSDAATPQNLSALATALQAGDLSQAQSALAALSVSGTGVPPFGNNVEADADYDSVAGAVESGNFSAAKVAFSNLQTTLNVSGREDSGAGFGRIISAAYASAESPTPPGQQVEVTV